MCDGRSIGQVAFEAWFDPLTPSWNGVGAEMQVHWERAAQAVKEALWNDWKAHNPKGMSFIEESLKASGVAEERERLAMAHDNEAKLEAARNGMSMLVVWHENQAKWLRAGGPPDFIVHATGGKP